MKRPSPPESSKGVVSGHRDIAVALHYDGDNAPRVTAKANDQGAREILRLAEAHDIPLYPNAGLATALVQIPLGEEVPEELYRAVAEVIAFAYVVAGRTPDGFNPPSESDTPGPLPAISGNDRSEY